MSFVDTKSCEDHRNYIFLKLVSWRSLRLAASILAVCVVAVTGFLFYTTISNNTSIAQHAVVNEVIKEDIRDIKLEQRAFRNEQRQRSEEQRQRYEELKDLIKNGH